MLDRVDPTEIKASDIRVNCEISGNMRCKEQK